MQDNAHGEMLSVGARRVFMGDEAETVRHLTELSEASLCAALLTFFVTRKHNRITEGLKGVL